MASFAGGMGGLFSNRQPFARDNAPISGDGIVSITFKMPPSFGRGSFTNEFIYYEED